MSIYNFTINNNQVTAVYEWDDGRWEPERIDYNETFTVVGNNVVKTETERYYKDITTYAPMANGNGYYKISETKEPIGTTQTPITNTNTNINTNTNTNTNTGTTITKLIPKSELYKFDISNGQVIAAYEYDHGRWEPEYKDFNETYSIVNGNVILTEVEGRWTEITTYSAVGDGTYRKVSETYTANNSITNQNTTYDNTDFSLVRLYKAVFHRLPDSEGFKYWEQGMTNGSINWDGVITSFLKSNEFVTKYGNASNEQFVNLLYQNVLNRQADADGYNYWLTALQNGTITREGVVNSFAQSTEFIGNTQAEALNFLGTI